MAPVVAAYQAMRGASFLVAATFAAEIGDVRRFDTPRQLMAFLGVWSRHLLEHPYRVIRRMRYGPGSTWERHDD
jgi:transposase